MHLDGRQSSWAVRTSAIASRSSGPGTRTTLDDSTGWPPLETSQSEQTQLWRKNGHERTSWTAWKQTPSTQSMSLRTHAYSTPSVEGISVAGAGGGGAHSTGSAARGRASSSVST